MFGKGNALSFEYRVHDARLGRWLSLDPLASKYPAMSPYFWGGNNPIIFMDPDGREIIYAGTEAQQAAARKLVADAGKDAKMAATIKRLDESDIKYVILLGSQAEVATHTADKEVVVGGITSYNFDSGEVRIGIENINSSDLIQLVSVADELKSGEQFEDGKIGFYKDKEGNSMVLGYDPTDELETKEAALDVLLANGKTISDLLDGQDINETNSPRVMDAIQKAREKTANGEKVKYKDNPLNVLFNKTSYKKFFDTKLITLEDDISIPSEKTARKVRASEAIWRENKETKNYKKD